MQEHKSLFGKVFFTLLSVVVLSSLAAPLLLRADTLDITPPEVDYGFQTPLNGAEVSGTITVDGNFNDNDGLAYVVMALGGNVYCDFGVSPESGYRTCEMDTALIPNGEYAISYWAINQAGLDTSLYTRIITVNNAAPADTTAPMFALKDVTRDENEFAPSYAEFVQSNPEGLAPVCSGLEVANLYVAQPSENKLVPVTCSVTDEAGNVTTASANLIVNNVQPQVVIIANPSTDVVGGNTVTLIANILHGNGSFSYSWTGVCSGNGSQNTVGLTNTASVNYSSGSYLCGINVTDSDGDVTAASVLLNFSANSQSTNSSSATTDTSSTTTTETTPVVETPAQVEGTSTTTNEPVSTAPQESTQPVNTTSTNSTNTNNTDVSSSTATSPLVIICLVAGGILIIGLLLFLFFRGEEEEVAAA